MQVRPLLMRQGRNTKGRTMATQTATTPAVTASIRIDGPATELAFAPPHDAQALVSDQPEAKGGTGRGPNPFSYVYAGLAACTAMTIRGYAERKELPLTNAAVELSPQVGEDGKLASIELKIRLDGDLSDDDRKRLLAAGAACPVRKALEAGIPVTETEA